MDFSHFCFLSLLLRAGLLTSPVAAVPSSGAAALACSSAEGPLLTSATSALPAIPGNACKFGLKTWADCALSHCHRSSSKEAAAITGYAFSGRCGAGESFRLDLEAPLARFASPCVASASPCAGRGVATASAGNGELLGVAGAADGFCGSAWHSLGSGPVSGPKKSSKRALAMLSTVSEPAPSASAGFRSRFRSWAKESTMESIGSMVSLSSFRSPLRRSSNKEFAMESMGSGGGGGGSIRCGAGLAATPPAGREGDFPLAPPADCLAPVF
mmetsp:Transcript_9255/g.20578  ORF Transcript_9255/g.20578 Transcript_9255/m.20578 type:complete len:271 (-) Transcript_9255:672-1484(-)